MRIVAAALVVAALAVPSAAWAKPAPPVSNDVIVANVVALFGPPAATRHVPANGSHPAYDCYLFQNARFADQFCIVVPPKKAGRHTKV